MDTKVQIVDTTLRDGNQSLWAQRMPTAMMLAVAEQMDRSGYLAMDVISTADFKTCVRELKEDPFERLDLLAKRLRRTTMASMCGPQPPTTFAVSPEAIIRLYLERLAAHGIRRMHMMEASNDMARVAPTLRLAKAAGLEVMIALTYSWTPKHTDAYYAGKARQAVAMGADRIYLKDPGGLITPERVRTLLPTVLEAAGDVPVEFHTHCTTSLATLSYLEGVRLGVGVVHTAIPPLCNGTSQPSVFNVTQNLHAIGARTQIDLDMAHEASRRLQQLAKIHDMPEGVPLEYDYRQYVHQIPGGVMATLRSQLAQMGAADRLAEVLEESVRVRTDLGYPIMVTPFSQFVVSQATLNVLLGRRYGEVVDEVINYTLGLHGEEAASGVDPQVRGQILDRPRAKELQDFVPTEPTLCEIRSRFGGPDLADDELLLRYIMGGEREVRRMREHGPIVEHPLRPDRLAELCDGLSRQGVFRQIVIEKGDFRLELGRGPERGGGGVRDAQTARTEAGIASPPGDGSPIDVGEERAPAASVPSPAVGIFRALPEQGRSPYVRIGERVDENAVIGRIEVFAQSVPAKAGVEGRLSDLCVQDGQFVEYGQVLCHVQPQTGWRP